MSPLLLLLTVLPPDTGALAPMETLLSSSVQGWNLGETPTRYPGMKIFEYMDGAGEIYRAYDFRDLLVGRYTRAGEEEILVEIFDMGLPANAFGVFTYMRGRGPTLPVGQEGEYKSGLLTFWKGRHFVCVKSDRETQAAKEAILEIGTGIAGRIAESGELPRILSLLPEGEFLPQSLRYFLRDEILNIHYYVGDGNLLQFGEGTEGVLVRMTEERSMLLLVCYPSEERSAVALMNFTSRYLPDSGGRGAVRTENGLWTLSGQSGRYVIVVFDAPDAERGKDIIESVTRRLP